MSEGFHDELQALLLAEDTDRARAAWRVRLERERTGLKSLQQLAAFAAVEYGLSPLGPRDDLGDHLDAVRRG